MPWNLGKCKQPYDIAKEREDYVCNFFRVRVRSSSPVHLLGEIVENLEYVSSYIISWSRNLYAYLGWDDFLIDQMFA